jgi:DNA-binding NarL/FixJ family response regulator
LDELTGATQPMPAELVELAAHLAVQAGRRTEAAKYLAEEARRSLSAGAAATAVDTARRASNLVHSPSAEATAADQVLLSALEFFEGCGHEPLARACRSLLRLAGASPRRPLRARTDGRHPGLELTTREADVMALVRHRLTNKQIANRLYLSTRTVEKHVERILAKTGSANRTPLAALASAHT